MILIPYISCFKTFCTISDCCPNSFAALPKDRSPPRGRGGGRGGRDFDGGRDFGGGRALLRAAHPESRAAAPRRSRSGGDDLFALIMPNRTGDGADLFAAVRAGRVRTVIESGLQTQF